METKSKYFYSYGTAWDKYIYEQMQQAHQQWLYDQIALQTNPVVYLKDLEPFTAKEHNELYPGYPKPTEVKVLSDKWGSGFHVSKIVGKCSVEAPCGMFLFGVEVLSNQDAATAIHLFKKHWCPTCLEYAEKNC